MASRKGKEVPSGGDVGGVTFELRAQLKHFGSFATTVNGQLKDVNQLHSELEDGKPLPIVKPRLDRAYDEIERSAKEEIKLIDRAVETLDMLYAMQVAQEAPPAPVVPPPPPIAPVVLGGNKRGPYKKKLKGDGSAAGSPAPSAAPSPNPHHSPSGSAVPLPRSSSSKSLPGQAFAPAPPPAAGPTTAARKKTKQERKELINQQLPLTPGRRVAFHQKVTNVAADGAKEEGWILAQITQCIGGDKTKYQVQDVDFDPNTSTEPATFSANIKSIIPLPDKHGKFIYDIPVGAAVMALYPDTTSFYRAVIVSGPEMIQAEKGKKKERSYYVRFDDDDDALRRIPVEMVVEMPSSMKTQALVVAELKAPFVLQDVELSELEANEVLIKVTACGLCHTDIAIQQGQFPSAFPSIQVGCLTFVERNFGRFRSEAAGSKGAGVGAAGEEILGSFFGQSALARHALVAESSCVKVPPGTDLVTLAPLGCGLQTGAGAVLNILKPEPASSIVVFGMGAVGCASIFAAKYLGLRTIIAIRKATEGLGADYAIEATGSVRVLRSAWESLRNFGTVCSIHDHVNTSKRFIGVAEGDSNPTMFIPFLMRLFEEGKFPVDRLIKTFRVEDFEQALAAMHTGEVIKPVIIFD
ncbi:hypothetical protein RQP46_001592 [Phenoliferia psychrophenolica]